MRFFILFSILAHFAKAQNNPCDCEPRVGENHPYRLDAKWLTAVDQFPHSTDTLSAAALHIWQELYAPLANKKAVTWNTPRLHSSPEDSIYTMSGWLWYIRKEADCDFHIQIGDISGMGSKRSVIEVSVKNCALQQTILDTLKSSGYSLSSISRGLELSRGLKVVATGLGFYDGEHGVKTPPKTVRKDSPLWKQEGTAWELHPVIEMHFLKD
jgi:hypothetical protein